MRATLVLHLAMALPLAVTFHASPVTGTRSSCVVACASGLYATTENELRLEPDVKAHTDMLRQLPASLQLLPRQARGSGRMRRYNTRASITLAQQFPVKA